MDLLGWAKSHPLMIAGGIFFVGLLLLMGRGGGGSNDGGMGAFYAAQAAQKASGDAVMLAQIESQSRSAVGGMYFDSQKYINDRWASTQLAQTQDNNDTAIALAPYHVSALYLNTVSDVANAPPITNTTTQTKKSGGIFGIGAKAKTTTTTQVVPNPAWGMLDDFWGLLDFAGPNNPAQLGN